MRTIKFRGKTKQGEWVIGYYVGKSSLDEVAILPPPNVNYDIGYINDSECYYCIADTLGQFTGLYDKNGKEIYEGDILDFNGLTVEVRFVRGVFAFLANGDLDEELCGDCRTDLFAKVIGNVYENPDILKGGEQ